MNTTVTNDQPLVTPRRRGWPIVAGVAAAVAVAIGSFAIINSGGSDKPDEVASPPIELSLGDGNQLGSCIQFDVSILADMPTAFAGTAAAVDGAVVTLDVDHWYKGGDSATVVLRGSGTAPSLINGFQFEVGEHYLVSATDGNVNFCDYSGVATPELTAAYEAAFGN